MNKSDLRSQIDNAILLERQWNDAKIDMDSGSYCENGSQEYKDACKIMGLYVELGDKLRDFERKYY